MPVDHNEFRSAARHESQGDAIAILSGRPLLPNTGIPLNLDWVREVRVNTSAVERRAQSQIARRTVKKEWQAAWLLRADHLHGSDDSFRRRHRRTRSPFVR